MKVEKMIIFFILSNHISCLIVTMLFLTWLDRYLDEVNISGVFNVLLWVLYTFGTYRNVLGRFITLTFCAGSFCSCIISSPNKTSPLMLRKLFLKIWLSWESQIILCTGLDLTDGGTMAKISHVCVQSVSQCCGTVTIFYGSGSDF